MTDDQTPWPDEAGDPESLPKHATSLPPHLEARVVAQLHSRSLLHAPAGAAGFRALRPALALAACVAFLAAGVLVGRATAPQGGLTGAETDLYALLLYETKGYDRPTGARALDSYNAYARWVTDAVKGGHFIDGHDLSPRNGWLIDPATRAVSQAIATDEPAPLSGVFFIRANDLEQALVLARALPHLDEGGPVLVQKTVPTAEPPEVAIPQNDTSAGSDAFESADGQS